MLIDFHTHAFPDHLAERAISKLAAIAQIEPYTNGTIESLRARMREYGVDRSVVCNIATNPKQQTNVNNFAIELNRDPEFISLASIHPESEDIDNEIERVYAAGIKGLKLHPDYMGYMIDDPLFEPILRKCEELGMFVIIHAGYDVISPELIHATPEKIIKVSDKFPGLNFIAAHFGSNVLWEDVMKYIVGSRVYIDTSLACYFGLKPELAKRIINEHDPDRILFGSDIPWGSPKETKDYLLSLELTGEMYDRIFHINAEKLLGEKSE